MNVIQNLVSYGEKKQVGTTDKDKNMIPIPEFEVEKIDPDQQVLKEFLDSILPPKKIEENNIIYYQFVSNDSAIVNDVIKLKNKLDSQMKIRHAKETGVCRIREELYNECFDEIIRQVSIGCMQRGSLLNRIKEESNYTIDYYQKLYESLISFSMRKVLQEKKKMLLLTNKYNDLQNQIDELTNEIETKEKFFEDSKIKYEQEEKEALEAFNKGINLSKADIQAKVKQITAALCKASDEFLPDNN